MVFPVTQSMRAGRRARAEERQAEYDKLSFEEKMEKLPPAPAGAKVRAKLEAQLAAGSNDKKKNK